MCMNRTTVSSLVLTLVVFAVTACLDFLSPVRSYLEEYTENVLILDHEIASTWSLDGDRVASVPSASSALVRFLLHNPRN